MNQWRCKECRCDNLMTTLWCSGCGCHYIRVAGNEDAHRLMLLEAKVLDELLERKVGMKLNELKKLAQNKALKVRRFKVGDWVRTQYIYSDEPDIIDQRLIDTKKIPYTKYRYMARSNDMKENSFYKITAKDYAELIKDGAIEE